MPWQRILLSLIPIPIFYLIYFRYFTFRPNYSKHLEAFLWGMTFALFLILISYNYPIHSSNSLFIELFRGAFIEKIGAFLIIFFLIRHFHEFSTLDATLTAIMFGIGFSFIENISYAFKYGDSIIIIRVIFSVPVHITTCGIIGYFLSLKKLSRTGFFKIIYGIKAFFYPLLLHTLFDLTLIKGGYIAFLAPPLMIIMVTFLEVLMAKSQTILPQNIMEALNLQYEDWKTYKRESRYERWIMQSMGLPDSQNFHLFQWKAGAIKISILFLFMTLSLLGLSFSDKIGDLINISIRRTEVLILFGIFPSSISMIILLVGAINPDFFNNKEIQIPIISDVDIKIDNKFKEIMVTYNITTTNCFLKTSEPLKTGTVIDLKFNFPSFSSPIITGEVIWENHLNKQEPVGTLITFHSNQKHFYRFIIRYNIFRFIKSLIFNLKLPGFESIRKFFVKPISIMQEEIIFPAGTIIFDEGDEGKTFYLLKKGKIMFYKTTGTDKIITMNTIESGEIFGEMALLGNKTRAATAICITDSVVAIADGDNMKALLSGNIEFSLNLIEALAKRIKISEKILVENITGLEKNNIQIENIFRTSIIIILTGLGYEIGKNKKISLDLNMKKISKLLKNVDKNTLYKNLNILYNEEYNNKSLTNINENFSEDMEKILKKYSIKF